MAGVGPPPKKDRRRRNTPARGEIVAAEAVGWQHGAVPKAPAGLMPATRGAWSTWFKAWFASFWSPSDLPALRQVIRLYDQVERGEFQRAAELRLQMDGFGITPKGQQDRRWKPPVPAEPKGTSSSGGPGSSRYGHLAAVPDAG